MGNRKISSVVLSVLAFTLLSSSITGYAFAQITCDANYEYRTFDGTCNNLAEPMLGSAGTELLRLSGHAYDDADSSIVGEDRYSPRYISNIISSQTGDVFNDHEVNDFIWQWGQFLDHDISLTPTDEGDSADIPVDDDPVFGVDIIFNRSIHNDYPPRQQINEITSFIDASNVYGSDDDTVAMLRVGTSAYMKTENNLLPKYGGFYMAGDVRANEGIRLIAMHTLFVLEHNRIAALLQEENPEWEDEQVFQTARKIVGAKIQAITYNEFLPKLLGHHAIPEYVEYDSTINPGIANEFSTASYRYGHSQVSSTLLTMDGKQKSHVSLADNFFNPELFEEIGMNPILEGIAYQRAQEVDTLLVDELRNFLFANVEEGGVGFDLASLNIQRGRDHGLPDLNTVRYEYGLPKYTSFDQIHPDKNVQEKLAEAYPNIDDIDLWAGGLAEKHLPGAMVGETISEVLIDQFTRTRDGDRFWYQNDQFFIDNPAWKEEVEKNTLKNVVYFNTGISLPNDVFRFYEHGKSYKGGGDKEHKTRPTFGLSHETNALIVDTGFKFNDHSFTIDDNHHTLFAQQEINTGEVNSFEATLYADKGLKVQEFLFGIPNTGEAHLAELGVEVWFGHDNQIQDIHVIQNSDVIDKTSLRVSHEKTKCQPADINQRCDLTKLSMVFLEPLKDSVMALKAIDFKNRFQITYLNDGIDVKGESLNPMKTEMIPSNIRNQGLIKVTQLEKYSPYWQSEDGRMFEMNSFGSFTEINQKFERFQDSGTANTRLHSGFGGVIEYEIQRATSAFDARDLIKDLPDSETVILVPKERMTEELKQSMLEQEEIAKTILENSQVQARW